MALTTDSTASAPLTIEQKNQLTMANAAAKAREGNPLLGGESVLEKQMSQQALNKLASEGRIPAEAAGMVEQPVTTTQASIETPPVSQSFVPQQPAQQPAEQVQQSPQIDVSGIRNVANQEAAGAERIINQADVEMSATQKKFAQDQKAIEDDIAKNESILAEENEKVKNFKFDDRSLWNKSSTGQKLVLLIGGFLSSMNNQSAASFRENIQRTIDQDLALQNKKLDELKDQRKMRESLLGQLRLRLGDKEKANMAYQNLIYSKMGAQLNANSAKYQSKIMAEKAALGASEAMAMADAKKQDLLAKSAEKKPLAAEAQQRLDNAKLALNGVLQMRQALQKGQNTFSLIGDNDFTLGQGSYVEGLGRMQSGGAIGVEEQKRFENFTPKATDSADIQQKKLKQAEAELRRRIQALEGTSSNDKSYFKAN